MMVSDSIYISCNVIVEFVLILVLMDDGLWHVLQINSWNTNKQS